MNAVLYLVAETDPTTPYNEFFDSMTIMGEMDLRNFVDEQIKLGNIAKANLTAHDCLSTTAQDMELETIMALLSDNDQYDEQHNYYVSQQEVNITDDDMYN